MTAPYEGLYIDADLFQGESIRTDWPDWRQRRDDGLIHAALGLASEAGEIAGIVQKWQGQGHDLDHATLIDEAGDALWFLAKLLRMIDCPMSQAMRRNMDKLAARYPNGWDAAASINRESEVQS